jgi:hypothetical protein
MEKGYHFDPEIQPYITKRADILSSWILRTLIDATKSVIISKKGIVHDNIE